MLELDGKKLNWDNNFSIRFKLENGKSLKAIPNHIYEFHMPDISTKDMNGEDMEKYVAIVLRSTQDRSVEQEVFNILMRTNFDVELSLSNPNQIDYVYTSCSIDRVDFATLANKSKANPFNFTIWAKVSQIIYKGADDEYIFGKQADPIVYNSDIPEDDANDTTD